MKFALIKRSKSETVYSLELCLSFGLKDAILSIIVTHTYMQTRERTPTYTIES